MGFKFSLKSIIKIFLKRKRRIKFHKSAYLSGHMLDTIFKF